MDLNELGKYIAQMRKEKRLTQEKLADKLNVHPKTISKWERGISAPDIGLLSLLSEVLGISVSELLNCKSKETDSNIDDGAVEAIKYYTKKSKIKYVKIFLLILFLVVFLFLSIIGVIKYNEFHLYEIHSNNKGYTINGYVGLNHEKSMLFINRLSFNDNYEGTNLEIEVKEFMFELNYGNVTLITNGVVLDEGEEPQLLSNILDNILVSIEDAKLDINSLDDLYAYISFTTEDDVVESHSIDFNLVERK